jgi:hypothetical protein
MVREAQCPGAIEQSVDADQLALQIDSLLLGASAGFVPVR